MVGACVFPVYGSAAGLLLCGKPLSAAFELFYVIEMTGLNGQENTKYHLARLLHRDRRADPVTDALDCCVVRNPTVTIVFDGMHV